MRYIYMDNYKGFQNTIFPIYRVNFLVGENSTGKTSVLNLIELLNSPHFSFDPNMALRNNEHFVDADSVISSTSKDRTLFGIGEIYAHAEKEKCYVSIYEFINENGSPNLKTAILYEKKRLKVVRYIDKKDEKIVDVLTFGIDFDGSDDEEKQILYLIRKIREIVNSIESIPPDSRDSFPPVVPFFILRDFSPKDVIGGISEGKFSINISGEYLAENHHSSVCKIAPIRTKPKRIYDGLRREFSAEGEHTAYRIHSILCGSNKQKKKVFFDRLNKFGIESGLFNKVSTRSFVAEDSPFSPFELRVTLNQEPLNINNVGYGISQVLPLLVEFLDNKESEFLVQQPEVHLHPRAQAALGGLIYECAIHQEKLSFILETHSDYLIDRYRLCMYQHFKENKESDNPESQILFFRKENGFNSVTVIELSNGGNLPDDLPADYREFFLNESLNLLEI